MSPKKKRLVQTMSIATNQAAPSLSSTAGFTFLGRDGLGAYISSPETFPSSRVLYYNDQFVAIHDLFPKSSIHVLVIPRHSLTKLHPFDAFGQDSALLKATLEEVEKVKKLVAAELRRRFGKFSHKEQARLKAMEGAQEGPSRALPNLESLPEGRHWEDEVIAGVHSGPSMNHLHVHVLSRDRTSETMRHRKHYNSFATPFLVTLHEFPLKKDDVRRRPDHGGYLRNDLKCWRCGKNFRNRFQELKRHLDEEFEDWKKE